MAQEQARQLLQQGVAAARAGRADEARDLLQQAIRYDPRSEAAWLWLSSVARDDKERLFCLKQLVTINPQNEFALKALAALGVSPAAAEETPAAGATSVPVLDEDKYTRIQSSLDDLLRRYSVEPLDTSGVEWVRKSRRRYGESGARRLQQLTYVSAAAAVVLVVGLVAVLLLVLGVFDGDGIQIAARATRVPTNTPTPTITPTPGGATPTPFPESMDIPPTAPPSGLSQGSIYANTATPVHPQVHPNIAGQIGDAIDYYAIADYPRAIGTLETQREREGDHCYESLVYFEAMSYAEQGGTQNLNRAAQLLRDALNYEPPRGYETCQDSALLLAGMAEVFYRQGQLDLAAQYSQQALIEDPDVVQASMVLARVALAQGDAAGARRTAAEALIRNGDDARLLLLAAEIELADNQPAAALEQVGRALYVNPVLQPALVLQAQSYLALAGQPGLEPDQRLQYYGLAVRSAQTLLLYYPGDPAGYLYLAQARLGEGNDSLAETALTRVLEARDDLPDSAEPVVLAVYRTRGELYYQQGRYEAARADLEQVQFVDEYREGVLVRLIAIILEQGEPGDYGEIEDLIDELLTIAPDNRDYVLLQARAQSELCTFYPRALDCAYDDVVETLSDSFIAGLSAQAQAEAYTYRALARYHLLQDEGAPSEDEAQQPTYEIALDDIEEALALRDTALGHYYRGLILEALGRYDLALEEFRWVAYWNERYAYPFVDDDFEDRMDEISDLAEELAEQAAASLTPTAEPPTATPPATDTAVPSQTPTATPTSSPTPTPAPTATPAPLPELP
ncbi:MAG: tetratricopeptide repeat protein [Chloroflexi bacterium]|nr:tetratricopeptide repeat protein [Chloroflexota bacterium]